ncbi:MAG: NAD(P)H-dependent oxidoreductase [Eggerthellaceae bacterium]|nr:NAD(P)H-dependent oxidoreductase [Eggerthellaceae bacterium]
MHRLIITGSPRDNGRTDVLGETLFTWYVDNYPKDTLSMLSVNSLDIKGCKGCDKCKKVSRKPFVTLEKGDPLSPCPEIQKSDAAYHHCVIKDGMNEVRKHLDAAEVVIVVSPVYFAGAPSQLKALIDRLQPYFWSDARNSENKRRAMLHVVGEGKDPYGYVPLFTTLQSGLNVAGFELNEIFDWIGAIDDNGDIVGTPVEMAYTEDDDEEVDEDDEDDEDDIDEDDDAEEIDWDSLDPAARDMIDRVFDQLLADGILDYDDDSDEGEGELEIEIEEDVDIPDD